MKPIRTALFAPGIKDKVMGKALESGADAVILDLEDSVPLASKAEARVLVAKVIDGVAAAAKAGGPQIYVRVNGAQTGLLADDTGKSTDCLGDSLGAEREGVCLLDRCRALVGDSGDDLRGERTAR